MRKARCGNSEPNEINKPQSLHANSGQLSNNQEPLRFTTLVNIWRDKKLKWFIEEYPRRQIYLKDHDIRRILKQAFYDWEKFCALTFEMTDIKDEAHFRIKFVAGDHNDDQPFDGPNRILAHAFEPQSGEIHFDDDEIFTDYYYPQNDSYTLRLVAAHVIGHALGISHSREEDSIMFPIYQQLPKTYELSKYVKLNLQKLYGTPEEKGHSETTRLRTTSTRSPDQSPNNNWCSGEFQTGCEGPNGELYLFKDNLLWRYQAGNNPASDPEITSINERFPKLNSPLITACVKSKTNETYIFRHPRLLKLETRLSRPRSQPIRGRNFPQDSRIALLHKNSIYLIHDDKAYSLNEYEVNSELDVTELDTFFNPPPDGSIKSGFTYGKHHYLFTKNYIYAYNSNNGDLISGYPKVTKNGWFACEKSIEIPSSKRDNTANYPRNQHSSKYYARPH